jgi:hypothetical protein
MITNCPYCYSKNLNTGGVCVDCGKDSKPVEESIDMIHSPRLPPASINESSGEIRIKDIKLSAREFENSALRRLKHLEEKNFCDNYAYMANCEYLIDNHRETIIKALENIQEIKDNPRVMAMLERYAPGIHKSMIEGK